MAAARIAALTAGIVAMGWASGALAQESATQPFSLAPATQPTYVQQSYPAQPAPAQQPAWRYPAVVETVHYAPLTEFHRGEFELTLGGQGLAAHGERGDESIGFVTFDFAWYFVDNLAVGVELGLSPGTADRHHHHDDDEEDNGLRAAEEMVYLRWRCLNSGPFSLYLDGGVGGLHADPRFPTGGRRDNFLAAVGGGVTWRLANHVYLAGGARAAFLEGGDWDSRHEHRTWSDGFQYYGGVTVLLP